MTRKIKFKVSALEATREAERKYEKYIMDLIIDEKDILEDLDTCTKQGLRDLPKTMKEMSISNILDIGESKSVHQFLENHFENFTDMDNLSPILGLKFKALGETEIKDDEPTLEEFHHIFYKLAKEAVKERFRLQLLFGERHCNAERRRVLKKLDVIEAKIKGRKIIRASYQLNITVTSGPHKGEKFSKLVDTNNSCHIGRSELPKFKNDGISLFKDEAVSSAHGLFEVKIDENLEDQLYYLDCHSSNGTIINEEKIEPNEYTEFSHTSKMIVGDSDLQINIKKTLC